MRPEEYQPGIGYGAYTLKQAAALLRTDTRNVRRYVTGYTYETAAGRVTRGPAVISDREIKGVVSFVELIELRYVRRFRVLGVKLGKIVATAEALAKEVGPLPFASKSVETDGTSLFAKCAEGGFIEPDVGQLVAEYAKQHFKKYEFDDNERTRLWRPLRNSDRVVIDAATQYGDPIIAGTRTPTRIIYGAFVKEQNIGRVADWYDVSPEDVKAAIAFETDWKAAS